MTHYPTITAPADLIASIPAQLGYVPTESVICIAMTEDGFIKFVARIDLANVAIGQAHSVANAAHQFGYVVLVTIAADRKAALVAHEVARDIFDLTWIDVIGNYYIPTLAEASTALDIDTLDTVDDVDTFEVDARNSEIAAATILSGRIIERNRDAITARYTAGDPIASATGHVDVARTIEELAAVVRAGESPTPDLITRTAAIITTLGNRDAMTRLTHYGNTNAQRVMVSIARHSTGDARIQALILAGFFAHLAGDGAAANIAYAAAETDCTGEHPRMLALLAAALGAGMSPTDMHGVILDADTVRETTGADLPG